MSDHQLFGRVGEIVRTATFPIEAGKVKEFAWAIKDLSPIFVDAACAAEKGFAGIPCPPTFTLVAALYSGGDAADLPRQLGLDLSRVVHGEQTWTIHRCPVVGDVLTGVSRIAKVNSRTNRAGQSMLMVTIKTEFVDAKNTPVADEEMLMIELPKPEKN